MSIFYKNLIWIAVFAFITMIVNTQQQETVCGKKEYRTTWGWAIIAILPIVFWTMMRPSSIGDTSSYMKGYEEIPEIFGMFSTYMKDITKDKGFYALTALIKIFVTKDVRVYFAILAAIQGVLLIKVYRKYSINMVASLFLFIASTDYISWMYNGIRQFLAVTITFACCSLILEKKYIKAIILILIASTIHGSALLVLPFLFVINGEAWNKKTILFIIGIIVAVAFVDRFTDILDILLQETQYKNVVSDWQSWNDDGTNILRVLVYSVPTILSIVGLKYIRYEKSPLINMCVNASIVSTGFYIVSMFTSGIFIGRIPIYFSLYNYILLPWEINHMFTEKSQKIIYLGMIGFYLLFYFYSITMI